MIDQSTYRPMDNLITRVDGGVARLTLSRPATLNALTYSMIHASHVALRHWERDARVRLVVIDSMGDRAFCAGGDIADVHRSAVGDGRAARALWRHEYALDLRIARYPKPIVKVLDGLVLGGGAGLGLHGRYRLITERTEFGMPEVNLGLAPDVGGLLLLARLPGELGTHLALTGFRIGASEMWRCGMAEAFVQTARLAELDDLLHSCGVSTALQSVGSEPAQAAPQPAWLDSCYAGDDVERIVARLRAVGDSDAVTAADAIEAACPTAVKVTLRAIRRAAAMSSLAECLHQDYRLSCQFLARADLAEGIRATVVDKDRRPSWSPATLQEVTDRDVDEYFAPG